MSRPLEEKISPTMRIVLRLRNSTSSVTWSLSLITMSRCGDGLSVLNRLLVFSVNWFLTIWQTIFPFSPKNCAENHILSPSFPTSIIFSPLNLNTVNGNDCVQKSEFPRNMSKADSGISRHLCGGSFKDCSTGSRAEAGTDCSISGGMDGIPISGVCAVPGIRNPLRIWALSAMDCKTKSLCSSTVATRFDSIESLQLSIAHKPMSSRSRNPAAYKENLKYGE
jgi:hypothetical protein